jgi:hypothetical protein
MLWLRIRECRRFSARYLFRVLHDLQRRFRSALTSSNAQHATLVRQVHPAKPTCSALDIVQEPLGGHWSDAAVRSGSSSRHVLTPIIRPRHLLALRQR